jgi:hypothetical protein
VVVGASATSGNLQYFTGEGPAAGTTLQATYTPSFTFTNGTDYLLDPFEGRIRFLAGLNKVKAGQTLLADYSYTQVASTQMSPFTQGAFQGRATVKQLTDIGINFIWTIPSASIRITGDSLAWDDENYATGTLAMDVLNNGGCDPFGTWVQYPETPDASCP